MMLIFIGNLGPEATEEQLRKLFALHGAVDSVTLVKDAIRANPAGLHLSK